MRANINNLFLMEALPLTQLAPGQAGHIAAPEPGQPLSLRLRELGFVPGTAVAVVRRGSLGDPIEVELRGYRICIRRADLSHVRVVVDGAAR